MRWRAVQFWHAAAIRNRYKSRSAQSIAGHNATRYQWLKVAIPVLHANLLKCAYRPTYGEVESSGVPLFNCTLINNMPARTGMSIALIRMIHMGVSID